MSSKRVSYLRSGVYSEPLGPIAPCAGITLDHAIAVQSTIDRYLCALDRGKASWDPERWDSLKVVRDAVFDVASDTGFNPANHNLSLPHARVVADVMNEEVQLTHAAFRKGRIRPLKTFDLLNEVHELVCFIIEQAMEPCL